MCDVFGFSHSKVCVHINYISVFERLYVLACKWFSFQITINQFSVKPHKSTHLNSINGYECKAISTIP